MSERVPNERVPLVTGLRKFDHVSRARVDLGLCTPRQMYDTRMAIVAHRVRVLGEPDELASYLCTFADARPCERITRQDQCLRPPAARTAAGQRSFAHRAASLLNTVPDDVKRLNPAAFRRAAKMFFSNRWLMVSVKCMSAWLCNCVCACESWHFPWHLWQIVLLIRLLTHNSHDRSWSVCLCQYNTIRHFWGVGGGSADPSDPT